MKLSWKLPESDSLSNEFQKRSFRSTTGDNSLNSTLLWMKSMKVCMQKRHRTTTFNIIVEHTTVSSIKGQNHWSDAAKIILETFWKRVLMMQLFLGNCSNTCTRPIINGEINVLHQVHSSESFTEKLVKSFHLSRDRKFHDAFHPLSDSFLPCLFQLCPLRVCLRDSLNALKFSLL